MITVGSPGVTGAGLVGVSAAPDDDSSDGSAALSSGCGWSVMVFLLSGRLSPAWLAGAVQRTKVFTLSIRVRSAPYR